MRNVLGFLLLVPAGRTGASGGVGVSVRPRNVLGGLWGRLGQFSDDGEGRGVLGVGDVFGVDEEALVHGLVEQPPGRWFAVLVEQAAAVQEPQDDLEPFLECVDVGGGGGELALGIGDLGGQLVLALLELVDGDGVVEVGVDQFGAGAFELLQPFGLCGHDPFALGFMDGHDGIDLASHGGDGLLAEDLVEPLAGDSSFDPFGGQVGQLAGGALLVAAETEAVAIARAVLAGGTGVAEALTAAGAEQAAHQVVAGLPGAVTSDPAAEADGLDSVPGGLIDQRLVLARVGHTLVDDQALVVRAREDAMHLAGAQRHRRPCRCWAGDHAPGLEFIDQVGQRVLAGGVRGEGPGDVRSALGVDYHRLDLMPVDHLGAVEVPQGGVAGGAPAAGLFVHALAGFLAEVVGVELGDGGHDAVHQHAAGALVDVLGAAHQLGAGLADGDVDQDIVASVAGHAIDFVHDDVVDVPNLQASQHGLQLRPISRTRRVAGVDELLDDHGAELVSLAGAVLTLGRQAVALGLAVPVGLAGRGDPQVHQRPLGG